MLKEKYKQILIICGIVLIIFVLFGIYFFSNNISNEDFEEKFFSNDNNFNLNTNEEIKNSTEEKETIIIHITGEVLNPGIVELKEGDRVIGAIEKAGGKTEKADISKVNLAQKLEDGEKIYIPSINDKDYEEVSNTNSAQKTLKVNINTAKQTELQQLPGIGESMAKRIITYRKENGKFKSIEELKNISGIGESKFNNLKEYVYVK